MIAGLELTTITAQFQGQTVNAAQANPYSLQAVQEAMIDLQLNPQDCLLILRRSVNNELTAEVDPSPTAYIKALNATGLHVQGCLVYYGDDFTYHGNEVGYDLVPSATADRSVANVAAVVIGLTRYKETKPYTYALIDRSQLDAAIDYQNAECYGGVEQNERTIKGLMLNVAIRFMMKWQINSRFPFPTDFSGYFRLLEAHNGIVEKCQQERQRLTATLSGSLRRFRSVKAIPSTIETLMEAAGNPRLADTILTLYEPPKPKACAFDFNDFGL
ncbi:MULTISPECIES: hypothetical protein [Aeromonas]|jgi:hypothetical protein|nr:MULTISPECIES: hypothetical protein [Aeromonas]QQQ16097.1 hypothetical protein JJL53_23825 [Aeromonas media]RDD50656.1 hypothetical protein ASJ36_07540 [Aeromonas sp. ARM81]